MKTSQTSRLCRIELASAVSALLVLAACSDRDQPTHRSTDPDPVTADHAAEPSEPADADAGAADRTVPHDTEDPLGALAETLGLGSGGSPLPEGLVLGGDCPPVGAEADTEIAAQAAAAVPLKVGLTLTNLWKPTPGEEYECLTQVTEIRRDSIDATTDCDKPGARRHVKRRLCRADLAGAHMLLTQSGMMTVIDASGEDAPETAVGTTWISLSRREFAELKRTGSVPHHYVQPDASGDRLDIESITVLRRERAETAQVVVNDRVVEIPVIRASGEASHRRWGRTEQGRVTALIMDDERFPFLVDYVHSTEPDDQPVFRLNYAKISYPDARADGKEGDLDGSPAMGQMERQLAEEKRVDVYGIYFDFNSDRIRPESEPVLEEIAGVLGRNPDWTLGIRGHTDNVGGDAYNLELSRRRTEAVRKVLVERFGISAERLTTAGYGAAAPKDTNDTPEGRARNRRVELVRQ
jgi:outer membrane protein OmpA-like peptidoglycan-associated protein